MALVNRAVTRGVRATILPGLALREGVPAELRTLVAVPILLTTREALEEHIERLEIHHLASSEDEMHFALLSDWTDADDESIEGDEALVEAAAAGIARLNRRHGPAAGGERFLLLHRRRVWNEGQRRWIGWERKRGKLHELNRLLRGAVDTTFIKPAVPAGVRYVITLDADTRMPREAARRLIGKMAHPLNRPRLDAGSRRVVEGYGVLQPRVTPSLPVGREGRYSSASSPARAASILTRRRYRTCTRIFSAKAPIPARASTTWMPSRPRSTAACRKQHASQPRSVRRDLRAPASLPISRWSRNSRRATTWSRRASTAGRAATGSCCRGLSAARRAAGARALEDAGQPAPVAVGAGEPRGARDRMDAAAAGRARLDRFRRVDDRGRDAASRARRDRAAARADHAAQPPARARRRRPAGTLPHGIAGRVPRAPGLANGRCDRKNALSAARQPPASARLGHGGPGCSQPPARPSGVLPAHERRRRSRRGGGARRVVGQARRGRRRCRSCSHGPRRRRSRDGRACRRASRGGCRFRRPTPSRCAGSRAALGATSRPS